MVEIEQTQTLFCGSHKNYQMQNCESSFTCNPLSQDLLFLDDLNPLLVIRKARPQKATKFIELHLYFLKAHEQQKLVNKNYFQERLK